MIDSHEAKANVGKDKEALKLRKLLKRKLRVTNVPKIWLETDEEEGCYFGDLFDFKGFLGTGSFGFVVQALDKSTGEIVAIKVSLEFTN